MMKRIWTGLWMSGAMALGMAQTAHALNPPYDVPAPPCPCPNASGVASVNSVSLSISCGKLAYGSVLGEVRLGIEEHTPSSMTATPQALRLDIGGYSLTSYTTISITPRVREVAVLKGGNTPMVFRLEGDQPGYPIGNNVDASERLIMVNANDEPVDTNPTYYDLLLENGDKFRFDGFGFSPTLFEFISVHSQGRIQTLEDLGLDVIKDTAHSTKPLRQVKTQTRLFDIKEDVVNGYSIKVYAFDPDLMPLSSGLYQVPDGATLLETWVFSNPGGNLNKIDIAHYLGESATPATVAHYEYTPANKEWMMTQDGGTTRNRYFVQYDSNADTQTYVREISKNGIINYKKNTVQTVYDWGTPVTSEQEFKDGTASITTSYTYYDQTTDIGGYKKKKTMSRTDGYWERYKYDADGRMIKKIMPWLDSSPAWETDSGATVKVIEYDYTVQDSNEPIQYAGRPRIEIEKLYNNAVETVLKKTFYAYPSPEGGERQEIVKECLSHNASYSGSADKLVTVKTFYSASESWERAGKLKSIVYPDGRKDLYTYHSEASYQIASGSYVANANVEKVTHYGSDASLTPVLVVNKSTRDIKVYDEYGYLISEETWVCTSSGGSFENIGWKKYVYDVNYPGRLEDVFYSDGTQENYNWGGNCCGMESKTDRYGKTISYIYDEYKRVSSESHIGNEAVGNIAVAYEYDGKGRKLKTTKTSSDTTPLTLVSKTAYDRLGRVLSSNGENLLTTSTAYNDANRTETTTYPGGGTRIVTKHKDGRVKSITGTAVVHESYEYGVNADNTQWTKKYIGNLQTGSPRWEKTTYDMLGRVSKIEKPAYNGGTLFTLFAYNIKGQLESNTAGGTGLSSAVTRYKYDEMGNVFRKGLDLDSTGGADDLVPDSLDRFTEYIQRYVKVGVVWYAEQEIATYPDSTGDRARRVVLSNVKERLTDLGPTENDGPLGALVAQTTDRDVYNQPTIRSTYLVPDNLDTPSNEQKLTQVIAVPTSSQDAIVVTRGGFKTSETSPTGVITSYGYDGLGRLKSQTVLSDADSTPGKERTVATKYNYYTSGTGAKGQVQSIVQLIGNESDPDYTTTYTYHSNTGLMNTESKTATLSNGTSQPITTTYTYNNATRRLQKVTGAQYPVQYGYDVYGQLNSLKTWQDASTLTAFVETTWGYDSATGLLINKRYDNATGTGIGPDYDYYADGKLRTRTWAREWTAPNDYVIRLKTDYSYYATGELKNIDYHDTSGSWDIELTYDRLGRQVGAREYQGVGLDDRVYAFTYDAEGRLDTETLRIGANEQYKIDRSPNDSSDDYGRAKGYQLFLNGSSTASQTITYGYDNPSTERGRFKTVAFNIDGISDTFTYSWADGADLLKGYSSAGGSPSASVSYGYEPNRDLKTLVENRSKGPIVSSYGYTYDEVGRRKARADTIGTANPVNNGFGYNPRSEVVSAIMGTQNYTYNYDDIGNRAGLGNTDGYFEANNLNQYYKAGSSFPTPYDDDGNLKQSYTGGKLWEYVWNAENRLKEMRTLGSGANPVSGNTKLVFKYDFMGRRYSKTVYEFDSSIWNLRSQTEFVYDGWNLIQEKVTDHSPSPALPITRSYVWGLDLSQTLQGAGGVGGLLCSVRSVNGSSAPFYAMADANGNITDYVGAAGNRIAHFEYDAFGQVVITQSPVPAGFPIRFSSKYQDLETGMNYYGYRYYSPQMGRWLNRDPVEESGGINIYMFVNNAPSMYIDPHGLDYINPYAGPSSGNELPPLIEYYDGCPCTESQKEDYYLDVKECTKEVKKEYDRCVKEADINRALYKIEMFYFKKTKPGTVSTGAKIGLDSYVDSLVDQRKQQCLDVAVSGFEGCPDRFDCHNYNP